MRFDTSLNLVWLSFGLWALASAFRARIRSNPRGFRIRACIHFVGVALIVAALFPYISATDDILRIKHFSAQQTHQHSNKHSQDDDLMLLYEAMDTPLLSHSCEVALSFFFVALLSALAVRVVDRIAPFKAGRSPPCAIA